MRSWKSRGWKWVAIAASGGSLFVLDTCDPTVRDTVLSGVGSATTSLASTFIQAFFESLQQKANDQTTTTSTVRADPLPDVPPQIFT